MLKLTTSAARMAASFLLGFESLIDFQTRKNNKIRARIASNYILTRWVLYRKCSYRIYQAYGWGGVFILTVYPKIFSFIPETASLRCSGERWE